MVVQKVNTLIENREYGRLFAVVHFASRQWKVTNEDLILIENHIEAECGDRIVLEKVCSYTLLLILHLYCSLCLHPADADSALLCRCCWLDEKVSRSSGSLFSGSVYTHCIVYLGKIHLKLVCAWLVFFS